MTLFKQKLTRSDDKYERYITKKNFDEHEKCILYYFITSLLGLIRWKCLIFMQSQISTL